MRRFRDILLTLDVQGQGFDGGESLPVRVRTALKEAAWLVKSTGARLTLMTVVEATDTPDVRAAAIKLIEHAARDVIAETSAPIEVAFGTPFVEIIRRVQAHGHDLVIVASRRPTALDRAIVGSTALRLLRKCPGAVWVTGRHADPGAWCVLTAVGSTGMAPSLLDLSAEMVALRGGEWHVLHCVEYHAEPGMRLQHRPREEIDAYRKGVREEDWAMLRSLTAEPAERTGVKPQLWLAEGQADEQILSAIDEQDAHLVVLGTVGRAGLPGVLIGNVAETVFKHAECSVLAIKPEGFVSPVA
ncbi:MAG: universal stress protein [Planctomycetota bacterium]|jgi:nucleotide-binding universal stress UspA family protein